jgi:two-component system CheB/CheR fusion protein
LKSLKYYQRIIDLLPELAIIIDLNGHTLASNLSRKQPFATQKFIDNCFFDALKPSTREDTKSFLRICARSNQPVVGKIHWQSIFEGASQTCFGAMLEPRSQDNEPIILLRMQQHAETNTRFMHLQAEIHDLNREIARRQHAERGLREQTQQLEVTLKSIGEAVVITDKEGLITFLNPLAEQLTGWRLKDAKQKACGDVLVFVDEDSGENIVDPALQAIGQRIPVKLETTTELICKQGKRLSIDVTAAPIESGAISAGAIVVFRDVSNQRDLEQELRERANRLVLMNQHKNQFLTMLAHELRSPVAPISNAVQVMKILAKDNTSTTETLQVVERQVSHIKRLIDDMLEVSRISSGKMHVIKKSLDIGSLIQSVCVDLRPQFQLSNIACQLSLPSKVQHIEADADRMTQVLQNLLNNALKFTPDGGIVSVTLSESESSVTLCVSDNGVGIEADDISDLFEPFTQAKQTLERSSGGLGLGLSLVKGIIELHDGSITVTSDGFEQGTTFSITLPKSAEQVVTPPTPSHNPNTSLRRILLIEDDQDNADTLSQLLTLMGHEVFYADTGPDGVEKANSLTPDLIICDIGLPGLDGFAVAQLLRQSKATASIPLVALTGYGESDFVLRAKDAGFDLHITKPASLDDLQLALTVKRSH